MVFFLLNQTDGMFCRHSRPYRVLRSSRPPPPSPPHQPSTALVYGPCAHAFPWILRRVMVDASGVISIFFLLNYVRFRTGHFEISSDHIKIDVPYARDRAFNFFP